jgi:hypothetical protein
MSYRGKVKYVEWDREERINSAYQNSRDWHAVEESCILAWLYPSPNNRIPNEEMYVDITSDVLDYYQRERISKKLVNEVNDLLHNVRIDYYYDEYDDEDYLDGELSEYI